MKRERLVGIQLARGVAALLVALYHSSRMIALPHYAGHIGLGGLLQFGYSGVDFFFVLSGFIIYFIHHTDLDQPSRLGRYTWRRITRIYPSYWLVTAGVMALLLAKHVSFDPGYLLRSVLLLPDAHSPPVDVAWTLVFEVQFYAFFAAAIFNLRLGFVLAALWLAFIIVYNAAGIDVPALAALGGYRNLQFFIGIAAAHIVLNRQVPRPLLLMGIGLTGFLACGGAEDAGLIRWNSFASNMLFATAAGVLIVGMVAAERAGRFRIGPVGEFFGGTSYLLYLVHITVIGLSYRAMAAADLFHRLPAVLCQAIAVSAAVACGALLYRYFEQPLLPRLNQACPRFLAGRPVAQKA